MLHCRMTNPLYWYKVPFNGIYSGRVSAPAIFGRELTIHPGDMSVRSRLVESIRLDCLACSVALALAALPVAAQNTGQEMPEAADAAATLDTISVTGTLLRGVAPTGTNVVGISREDIAVLGKASTNDLLSATPQASNLFNQVPTPGGTVQQPFVRLNLRNLGASGGQTTLVLVNGQRMVGMGVIQTAPDASTIPVAVIERIEVVPDGGSSTYGSDAIGGVINFITRRRYRGAELSARYGVADGGYHHSDTSLTFGNDWGSGSAMLSYQHVEHNNIAARDRSYMRSDHSARGGSDLRPLNCAPGNILLDNVVHALPGRTANTVNRCDDNLFVDFYPAQRRQGVFGSLFQQVNDDLAFDLTAYYSLRSTRRRGIDARDGTGLRGTGTITAANPYFRPIGTETAHQVQFSFSPVAGDALLSPQKFSSIGITPSLTWTFADDWQLKTSANYGRSSNELSTRQVNAGAISSALAATDLDTALNPYDVTATSADVLATILNYEFYGQSEQEIRSLRSIADGSVFTLPAGEVKLAIGAEYYRESIDAAYGQGPVSRPTLAFKAADRHAVSVFAETVVPVFGDESAVGALDLSASVRYDKYNDVGSTTNPKIGFNWYPLDYLRIRGNWGTSFHAPSLADTDGAVDTRAQVLNSSPFRHSGSPDSDFLRPTILLAGGNPDLKPEEADTWSFGFDWTPAGALDGLSLAATWFDVKFSNAIVFAPFFQGAAFYDNPSYSGYWTLNPTQAEAEAAATGMWVENAPSIASLYSGGVTPYVLIDARRQNLGQVHVNGLDISSHYTRALGVGELNLMLGGTYTLKRKSRAAPGSPEVDDLRISSRYFGVASAGYTVGNFTSLMTLRHRAGYDVENVPGQTQVASFSTVDVFLGYALDAQGAFSNTRLTLNLDNIFDRNPPWFNDVTGYANGSTLGRTITLGVQKRF